MNLIGKFCFFSDLYYQNFYLKETKKRETKNETKQNDHVHLCL